jgi:hypothetical protein
MKFKTKEFRELTIAKLRNGLTNQDKDVSGFLKLVKYYSIDTNRTEFEVIYDDKLYNIACGLYEKHRETILK